MKILSVGDELFRADGQTGTRTHTRTHARAHTHTHTRTDGRADGQTDTTNLNSFFLQFWERSYKLRVFAVN